jgi:hypothetical protein
MQPLRHTTCCQLCKCRFFACPRAREQVKGQLLRELLVESKAYGYLLGSGGAAGEGGALARFVPDARERGRVLEAVAHECAASAQASPCRRPGRPDLHSWGCACLLKRAKHALSNYPLLLAPLCPALFCPAPPSPTCRLQLEEAVELFMFAGRPRQALRILNQRLSDAVEAAATDASRGECACLKHAPGQGRNVFVVCCVS